MELFLLALAAHFIADYPLQTNWIFAQKVKGFGGGAYHALTVLAMHLVFLTPYLHDRRFVFAIFVLVGFHYVQDYLKIRFADRPRILVFESYTLDQLLHYTAAGILAAYGTSLAIEPDTAWTLPWHTPTVTLFIIFLLITTLVWDITQFIWYHRHGKPQPLARDWRGIAWRGVLATVVFWGGYAWLIGTAG